MIDGIIQVNDDNIDDVLDTTYEIMLMFCNGYADACSNHRKPYVRAAQFLAKLEKPVYLGEVDIEKSSELEERYNITSYPTYMIVYSFGRDPEKLKIAQTDITFAKEALRRNYVDLIEVKTPEEWEDYKTSLSITTLGVFETKECDQFETYEKLAMGKNNAVFFYTTNPEIIHTSDTAALYSFHHSDGNTMIHFTGGRSLL
ncbi:uncharacterized protein [Blastocystis hominis]|uniref:Thioredoxin domain-containing protein n=1 Tax=Blastocystis hominis TaxID=12968 RepID=D8MAS6_BLAHO|nr:uncharacterized protein [Blastocystis hominis]CBK25165.2 unnamed protein product [Blastocystis hominis]|eukprot:XP_012899213.1 uncharacterized protein [Blastocystis hominis]